MKSYNIAVCFSGEARTWKSNINTIKRYFSSDKHSYYFFGHTWSDSYYLKECTRNKNVPCTERYLPHLLSKNMKNSLGFIDLEIQNKNSVIKKHTKDDWLFPNLGYTFAKKNAANYKRPYAWSHMSYSIMRANALKQRYELANNMVFDFVIRTRFDLCYAPNIKFEQLLENVDRNIPIALYADTYYFPFEYYLPEINDIFYFGSSRVMDIVDGFYRYWGTGKFWEMLDENWNDCALKNCGYNVNLYKWIIMKNILIKNVNPQAVVVRKTVEHMDVEKDFEKIAECDRTMFL